MGGHLIAALCFFVAAVCFVIVMSMADRNDFVRECKLLTDKTEVQCIEVYKLNEK